VRPRRTPDGRDQLADCNRLEQIPKKRGLVHASKEHLRLHVAGHEDALHVGILFPRTHQKRHPVASRHEVVGHDHLEGLLTQNEFRLANRVRSLHVEFAAQRGRKHIEQRLLIVDEQHGTFLRLPGLERIGFNIAH